MQNGHSQRSCRLRLHQVTRNSGLEDLLEEAMRNSQREVIAVLAIVGLVLVALTTGEVTATAALAYGLARVLATIWRP